MNVMPTEISADVKTTEKTRRDFARALRLLKLKPFVHPDLLMAPSFSVRSRRLYELLKNTDVEHISGLLD